MTSKAERLGASSAFGRAGTARSARGRVTEKVLGGSDDGPTRLALHLLSHNPDNPRDSLPDVTELAASLRDHGQKSAVTIMSREAYLAANPEREDELEPRAAYVVIDGNCRLAAARQAGLSSLRVMMDESLGGDPDELLESALVANIHRQDLDPLDEARALKKLLEVHGTQDKLAKRLHRSQGWVSQRLALLSLTPELQKRLEAGEEPVDLLRAVGKKPPEQQERELARLKEERARKQAAKEAPRKRTQQPAAELHYGVMKEAPSDGDSAESELPVPNTPPAAAGSAPTVPAQSTAVPATDVPRPRPTTTRMPWDDPGAMCALLREEMAPEDLRKLFEMLRSTIEGGRS
ncbi:ParB/RepB/Spo0J family partition protein [Streptomyces sp. TRM43335]|uniref:ParB/RepB/Spo0J family partition protein n=1 Tax=Streptomyces taklimakanensis TaxID=2569853 RepID=A0A6G2BKI6_9ACTN|nr:ParB/RepB/Spo0J family partition protein [Streptomyces taklimakanensis]MTE22589.1 ParB/RepB/Spo0J family partition protein [Streptomyces taklimakanensis]